MGSSKRSAPVAGITGAKDRHKKAQRTLFDPKAPLPAGLVAKPTVPKLKHHTYFEIMENKDKKKKLEFKVTTDKKPPPGFEFVPMGNPSLTTACKELSREKDAMIFIVSNLKDAPAGSLSHQVHRIGHHIRESIVEEAREKFDVLPMRALLPVGEPEPIPTSQTQYNAQVDAAIRDLFPRIPNTDRQVIIDHAFDLSAKSRKAEKPVGLSADITLARRVQLAVLAHIRHSHTRYDELRKETSWINARRVVEALCLDILVKWRGDEETGRDQLDEILQEVVVISDSEDDAGDDADGSSSESDSSVEVISPPARPGHSLIGSDLGGQQQPTRHLSRRQTRPRLFGGALSLGHARTPGRKEQRGFKRYRAWQEAIQRSRAGEQSFDDNMMPKSVSHGPYHQSMGGSPQLPSALHPLPESRFGHIPEDLNRAQEPMTHAYEIFHPSRLALPERAPTEHTLQSRMESLPPERQPSPPILDRFKDLLVQSIEPDSPDIMQPSFVQPVRAKSREPRNYGYLREEPFLRPPHDASCDVRFASPQRSPRYRRFGEDQLDQAEFPGGFIQVSRHRSPDAHRPRPHHFVPPSAQVVEEPLLVTSRVRPRGPDHLVDSRPAKRLLLAPSPLAHPIEDFYMRDRGGFLEKVPLLRSEGSRSMPPDPGFIEIRRRPGPGPEADRVVSHEEGRRLRNEPGVEVLPISNSPARSSGGPLHGAPQTVHQPFEPSLLSPYHGPPQDTVPVHYSRPQRVFRYVRGTGPGAQHQPTHQPFDDYSTPYQETPPIQGWAHREIERPDYGYGQEDGRTTGCLSYTPSAGLDG